MKNLPSSILGCTTAMFLLCAMSDRGSAADLAVAEAAVRKSDADWAAAMAGNSVEAWMSFYAADVIVLLPNDQPADGADLVRRGVTRLLAPPHLAIAWHTTKVQMSRSGDVAYLAGVYELRFDDSRGTAAADRGTLLRIWRKQTDGNWMCVVDTWSPDAPLPKAAAAIPAPIVSSPTSEPMPAEASTKYGALPAHYKEAIQQCFKEHLKDPGSVQYQKVTEPQEGYTTAVTGGLLMRERRDYGWTVKAIINAKNSHGRYVGLKTYTFLFRGEKIMHTLSPLSEDELN
jgi:ketosteroid isomerase-like protein